MDPSEPSESIFVHRSQIVSIGHICKKGERRKRRFWIRPGRTSAWWDGFVSEIVLPEEWRENFRMSRTCLDNEASRGTKALH